MALSLNKVTLIGNVGKDPEIRNTSEGKEIANFTLATSDNWKDKISGDKKERTEWHRIVVFNEGLVGVVKNYVKKGAKLYIEGNLQTRKWQDNSGVDKYTTEVILQNYSANLIILDSKNLAETSSYSNNGSNNFDHSEIDDEIPF